MKHFLDFKMILLPRDSVDNLTGWLHQYRLLQSCQSLWQDNRISRKILSCRLKDINLSKTIIFFGVLWGFRGKEARLCETFYVTSCSSRELECALVNFKYGDLRALPHNICEKPLIREREQQVKWFPTRQRQRQRQRQRLGRKLPHNICEKPLITEREEQVK